MGLAEVNSQDHTDLHCRIIVDESHDFSGSDAQNQRKWNTFRASSLPSLVTNFDWLPPNFN